MWCRWLVWLALMLPCLAPLGANGKQKGADGRSDAQQMITIGLAHYKAEEYGEAMRDFLDAEKSATDAQGGSEGAELRLATTSAIDALNASQSFSVMAVRGCLLLTANASQSVTIYSASGQKIWRGNVQRDQQLSVPASTGTYIVKSGEQVKKVLVP